MGGGGRSPISSKSGGQDLYNNAAVAIDPFTIAGPYCVSEVPSTSATVDYICKRLTVKIPCSRMLQSLGLTSKRYSATVETIGGGGTNWTMQ